MAKEIVIGLHLYQPPRSVSHKNLCHIKTDLKKFKETGKDWTQIINENCYQPLAKKGVFEKISYTYYGILQNQLECFDPQTSKIMETSLKKGGVSDPYIHQIMPDLTLEEKRIVVGSRTQSLGFIPEYFWAPESALDNEVLMVLEAFGYKGVILAPEQIDFEIGTENKNKPTMLKLPNQKGLLALPFNRPLSVSMAFADPEEWSADHFTSTVIEPEANKLQQGSLFLGWTDGETFGEHNQKMNADFLWWLLNVSLPEKGFNVISINEINTQNPNTGVLKEKTSWSCTHGLTRWHGTCSCCKGDLRWKAPYYRTNKKLNKEVTAVVKKELGLNQEDFENLMIGNFSKQFKNPGPPHTTLRLSYTSAFVSANTATTSCATFFDNPHSSGNINLLFAQQAIEHLKDAGLTKKASEIESDYRLALSKIPDPINPGKTVLDMLCGLLNQ